MADVHITEKLTLVGWAVVAAAALGVLVYLTGEDQWATSGEAAAYVVIAGFLGGLLCWAVAAFAGPVPSWWLRANGSLRRASSAALLAALLVVPVYTVWSLPWLEDSSDPWSLLIGVACAVAALRAASLPLALPLGVVATFLVTMGSGEAAPLYGHGALTLVLVALLVTSFEAERPWVRRLAAAIFVAGLAAWLFLGLVMLLFFGCGPPGCFA